MALEVSSPFIWGAGGSRKTPDQIAREREIAEALMAQGYDASPVGHWAEGLARMANVASGKIREGRADRAEQENATASQQRIASMLGGMGGTTSSFPAAPAPAGGATSYAAPDAASARVASAHGDPAIRDGIIQTAEALGIDPIDLATTISYETAGTFDPTKAGPTTQWGQHRGFIQFGEPQAQEHGVNWNDPVASQLGPNGAVASYLRKAGVQPGMGLLDIYSAVNAGAPGLYNRSDANNGGAPGTVRDKVEQQMAGHRQKALSLIGDYSPASAVAATEAMASGGNNWTAQQASLLANSPADPASWPAREAELAAQNSPQWVNDLVSAEYGAEPTALAPIETEATEPMAAPMLSEPQTVQDRPVAPVERVAQAMFPMEEMAGMNPRVLPSQGGGINPAVMEALSNPYASAQERQIAGVLLEQQLRQQQEANDPMRRIEMERAQLELDQMRNPRPRFTNVGGGYIFNENTGEFMAAPNQREQGFRRATPEEAAAFGVPGGQFGPDGRFYPVNPPSGMAIEADGQGGIRVVQGAGVQNKPFTEGQSKDNVYSTRARGALPTINALEQNLTSLGDRALDYDPTGIVRGRAQDEDYQVAKAAGDEFLQAILRKDTGAAITVPEQELYGKTYLPQPGDGPEVIAYKRKARERAVAAIESGMSPAQMVAQERALAASGGNAPMDPNAVPEGVDPADWEYMTDEEKAMFR